MNIKEKFINEYNENVKNSDSAHVIIFDTFEDFLLDENWLFNSNSIFKYGTGLCHTLDKTVWIFSGREMLKIHDGWDNEVFKKIKITNFDFLETNDYIFKKRIDKQHLDLIWRETNGNPLKLFLLSDIYQSNYSEKDFNMIFDDKNFIELNNQKFIERYLRYLEKDQNDKQNNSYAQYLRVLVCIGYWKKGDELNWSNSMNSLLSNSGSNFNIEDIYSKSLIVASENEYGETIFSVNKNIRALLFYEKYRLDINENEQPIISKKIKEIVLAYLCDKLNSNKRKCIEEAEFNQINILIDNIYENESSTKKLKLKLDTYFEQYINFLSKNDKSNYAIKLRLDILNETDLLEIEMEYLNSVVNSLFELITTEDIFVLIDDIEFLLSNLPEDIKNNEAIAKYYSIIRDDDKAICIYEKLLQNKELTIIGWNNYIHILIEKEKFSEAKKVLSLLLSKLEDISSKNESEERFISYKKSQLYFINNDYEKVINTLFPIYYQYKKRETLFKDSNYADCLILLGISLSMNFELDKALEVYFDLLRLLSHNKEFEKANIYNNIATVYHKRGDTVNRDKYSMKALILRRKYLPINHPERVQSENNFAMTLMNQRKYGEAIEIFTSNLENYEKNYEQDTLRISRILSNIGISYYYLNDYDKSTMYLQKSFDNKNNYYKGQANDDFFKSKTWLIKAQIKKYKDLDDTVLSDMEKDLSEIINVLSANIDNYNNGNIERGYEVILSVYDRKYSYLKDQLFSYDNESLSTYILVMFAAGFIEGSNFVMSILLNSSKNNDKISEEEYEKLTAKSEEYLYMIPDETRDKIKEDILVSLLKARASEKLNTKFDLYGSIIEVIKYAIYFGIDYAINFNKEYLIFKFIDELYEYRDKLFNDFIMTPNHSIKIYKILFEKLELLFEKCVTGTEITTLCDDTL